MNWKRASLDEMVKKWGREIVMFHAIFLPYILFGENFNG